MKQLDWKHAREICEKYHGHKVSAGLSEDWFCTGGTIYDGEKYVDEADTYVYVASMWATPVVVVEFDEGDLKIPCWMEGCDSDMPNWWAK